MGRKDSAALLGFALGTAVQVGDRLLVARAMRSRPRGGDAVDRRRVVAVTSAFYLLPAAGSVVAFAANRAGRDRDRGSVVPIAATGLVLAGFALRASTLRCSASSTARLSRSAPRVCTARLHRASAPRVCGLG